MSDSHPTPPPLSDSAPEGQTFDSALPEAGKGRWKRRLLMVTALLLLAGMGGTVYHFRDALHPPARQKQKAAEVLPLKAPEKETGQEDTEAVTEADILAVITKKSDVPAVSEEQKPDDMAKDIVAPTSSEDVPAVAPVITAPPTATMDEDTRKAFRNTQMAFRTLVPVVVDAVRLRISAGQPYAKQAQSLVTLLRLTGSPLSAEQEQQLMADGVQGLPSLDALRAEVPKLLRAEASTTPVSSETAKLPEQLKSAMGKLVIIKRGAVTNDEADSLQAPIEDALFVDTVATAMERIAILPDSVQQQPGFADWKQMVQKQADLAILLGKVEEGYP